MANGQDAVWPAIDGLRRDVADNERDVAVIQNEVRGLATGQAAMDRKLEQFKKEIVDEILTEVGRLDERFNTQARRIAWGIGICAPVITALVAALLSRGP